MTNQLVYTVEEAAKLLRISRASAYTHVRTGAIRSVSLGSRILVPKRAIEEIVELKETG